MAGVDKVKFQDILGSHASTMSSKQNKSPEDVFSLLSRNADSYEKIIDNFQQKRDIEINNEDEVTGVAKEDGVAVLLVVLYEIATEKEWTEADPDILHWSTDSKSIDLEKALKFFLYPDTMWVLRNFDEVIPELAKPYWKIRVLAYTPKTAEGYAFLKTDGSGEKYYASDGAQTQIDRNHFQSLHLPHMFRTCIENQIFDQALLEKIGKHNPDEAHKNFSNGATVLRCECICSRDYGPAAATGILRRWTLRKKEAALLIDPPKTPNHKSMIKKRADYVQYLADIQWGQYTEMAIEKKIQFVVLDEIYKNNDITDKYKHFLLYNQKSPSKWPDTKDAISVIHSKDQSNLSYQEFITECKKKFTNTTSSRDYSVLVAAEAKFRFTGKQFREQPEETLRDMKNHLYNYVRDANGEGLTMIFIGT